MTQSYNPDNSSLPTPPWGTVYLSQRDVAAQVPINYVTQPGVVLAPACFAHGRYQDKEAGDCISNLLAVGYRRFVVDVYWDSGRQDWGLCPVSIPKSIPNNSTSSTSSPPTPPVSSETLSSVQLQTGVELTTTKGNTPSTGLTTAVTGDGSSASTTLQVRSVPSPTNVTSSSIEFSATGGLNGTVQPSVSMIPNFYNEPFYEIGPYACTPTITLSLLTSLLLDYVEKTQNTLEAHMIYLILNLHAAASASSPTKSPPAPAVSNLPDSSDLLSLVFDASMSPFIYTPTDLRADRANLNSSWYASAHNLKPLAEYYTTTITPEQMHTTFDGWPSESYVEVLRAKRMLLGWGSIDTQMQGYNFTGDAGIIFPSGELHKTRLVNGTSSADLEGACFSNANTTDLVHSNSSWAVSSQGPGFDVAVPNSALSEPLISLSSNLTACGISPIIDKTLFNVTANVNITAYQEIAHNSVWTWAPDEPRNSSRVSNGNNDALFRCAVVDPALNGRWRVDDCSSHYYAACRIASQPYMWQFTTYPVTYSSAEAACPGNSTFAVPRTSLENFYLNSVFHHRRDPDANDNIRDKGVWVDFNSLDVQACWVSGGPNATCSYYLNDASIQRRTVLVPVIAGIIVLVITALTFFVKCNANRRSSRRRKRGEAGWDYEGFVQSIAILYKLDTILRRVLGYHHSLDDIACACRQLEATVSRQ
ncbi:MAG: hypothetical protein M1830_005349 [Pleopsidium flavum]|nr:MAG: hypothetical protein M1830_005349 [Pleopsidium flavum]